MLPPAAVSLDEAHAAIELWEHYKRRKLDPTQRLVVEVMMATRADGLWAADTTGREMPRQNGKGDEVEVVELWGLVQRSERILHTIHDAVLLATETQSRLLSMIEGHPDLRRLKLRAWQGTGQQMIEMRNGGIVWYRTRTGGGARGVDEVDRIVVDEAQHAEFEHLSALTSTQLASANPQLNAIGTAGIDGKSQWWWEQRKQALTGGSGSFGYVGHTAEVVKVDADGRVDQAPVDAQDRTLWPRVNPALPARRTTMDYFERELRLLGDALFAREHLCVWDPPPDEDAARPIPLDVWAALHDPDSVIDVAKSWALSVSPDRKFSSFGIAGRRVDGRLHVETMTRKPGTSWVLDAAAEFYRSSRLPLRIHKSGPEGALIAPLVERGVKVEDCSSTEVAQATGQLIDAANGDQLKHLDQMSLNIALRGAVLRESTDGAVVWSQRNSTVEISALMAVTVAAGGVPVTTPAGGLFLAVT